MVYNTTRAPHHLLPDRRSRVRLHRYIHPSGSASLQSIATAGNVSENKPTENHVRKQEECEYAWKMGAERGEVMGLGLVPRLKGMGGDHLRMTVDVESTAVASVHIESEVGAERSVSECDGKDDPGEKCSHGELQHMKSSVGAPNVKSEPVQDTTTSIQVVRGETTEQSSDRAESANVQIKPIADGSEAPSTYYKSCLNKLEVNVPDDAGVDNVFAPIHEVEQPEPEVDSSAAAELAADIKKLEIPHANMKDEMSLLYDACYSIYTAMNSVYLMHVYAHIDPNAKFDVNTKSFSDMLHANNAQIHNATVYEYSLQHQFPGRGNYLQDLLSAGRTMACAAARLYAGIQVVRKILNPKEDYRRKELKWAEEFVGRIAEKLWDTWHFTSEGDDVKSSDCPLEDCPTPSGEPDECKIFEDETLLGCNYSAPPSPKFTFAYPFRPPSPPPLSPHSTSSQHPLGSSDGMYAAQFPASFSPSPSATPTKLWDPKRARGRMEWREGVGWGLIDEDEEYCEGLRIEL